MLYHTAYCLGKHDCTLGAFGEVACGERARGGKRGGAVGTSFGAEDGEAFCIVGEGAGFSPLHPKEGFQENGRGRTAVRWVVNNAFGRLEPEVKTRQCKVDSVKSSFGVSGYYLQHTVVYV